MCQHYHEARKRVAWAFCPEVFGEGRIAKASIFPFLDRCDSPKGLLCRPGLGIYLSRSSACRKSDRQLHCPGPLLISAQVFSELEIARFLRPIGH